MSRKSRKNAKHTYIVVYKPVGILGDFPDPEGRPTVRDLVPIPGRLFVAGRLDARTEGLIVLTNDGRFAHKLTHPRYGFEREYLVQVQGQPNSNALSSLVEGIRLNDTIAKAHSAEVLETADDNTTWLKLILKEGKKRQIRRMLAAVGHPVIRLIRTRFGPLELGTLEPSQWRFLTHDEIQAIKQRGSKQWRS